MFLLAIIKYNDKLKQLDTYYEQEEYNNAKEVVIKLIGINSVTDMSYMFYECKSLSCIPDIDRLDTSKVINMSYMFSKSFIFSSISGYF